MTMIFLNILLGFLTGAGLLVFVVLYPGIIGKRSEILFQKQEVVAAVGIVVSALCVVLLWLLHSTSFGTLFAQVFIN